jgi:hypothetical protein
MPRPRCSSITVFSSSFPFSLPVTLKVIAGSSTIPRSTPYAFETQADSTYIEPEPFADVTVLFEQEHYRLNSSSKVTWVHVADGSVNPIDT